MVFITLSVACTTTYPILFLMLNSKAIKCICFQAVLCLVPEIYCEEVFDGRDLAFFESKVRPLLAERCYNCHSHKAEKLKGSLYLDSRSGALRGGDNGPAVTPGDFSKSLLVEAVRYRNPDLQMPPKSKLSSREIEVLEKWVSIGAPWPDEPEPSKGAGREKSFDIKARKDSHWAWKPVVDPALPSVEDEDWGFNGIDKFVLARLEKEGLSPSRDADRRTLIRRVTFALRGMPPSTEEVRAFLSDDSKNAWEKVVDRLLEENTFGETWARHWMDLFRYAESRGHEFDYNIPNAYRYRDYLIRALNADIPYDDFVTEHVAGDLLENPRLHPETGANESILATGFWFLGEWIHSPVDIRQDEADRFANMIDVFSKSFLGLTVACARCHDHKFDAISTKDFYSLQGYLQSSGYRQARYETIAHNGRVSRAIAQLVKDANLPGQASDGIRPALDRLEDYLLAAGKVLRSEVQAVDLLDKPESDSKGSMVFADFEDGTYGKWLVTGTAFGDGPVTLATKASYQHDVRPNGKFFVNSHNVRSKGKSASVQGGDDHVGTLTSPRFRIERDYVSFSVGGGSHKKETCVNLMVDGKTVLSATGRNSNTMFPVSWDVRRWKGSDARIQIVDRRKGSWGNIGFDHLVFSNEKRESSSTASKPVNFDPNAVELLARSGKLDKDRLLSWTQALAKAKMDSKDFLSPLANVLVDGRFPGNSESMARGKRFTEALGRLDLAVDYGGLPKGGFMQDGYTFGSNPVRVGELLLEADGTAHGLSRWSMARRDPAWKGLRVVDSERDAGRGMSFHRAGMTLRTPTFENKHGDAHYLVRGKGKAFAVVDSHRMINGPLHGNVSIDVGRPGELTWASQDLDRAGQSYLGHRLHVEFTPTDGNDFEVLMIDLSRDASARNEVLTYLKDPPSPIFSGSEKLGESPSTEQAVKLFVRNLSSAVDGLGKGMESIPSSIERARFGDWIVRNLALLGMEESFPDETFRKSYRELVSTIKRDSRTAMAMLDGSPETEYVFLRGNHRSVGERSPRRFMEALGGSNRPAPGVGSGRFELARQITDPEQNPFVSRVLVNRLWHHLLGRGIVPSTDDFGVLGQMPTHPGLLDHLASRLVFNDWSVKKTIKEILLSRTYRMSSAKTKAAEEADPANLLLHRANVRRLPAEAIRDSLIFLSGRLDRKAFGPSVPTYLTAFMQGRGRPRGGPLDGAGRRSVYLSIRRNFLSPLMLSFDTPSPFSSVGRRTTSNVPSQALILMNDPLVVDQAARWAKRLLGEEFAQTQERVGALYESAFSRAPSKSELDASLAFLVDQAKLHGVGQDHELPWRDLAHAVINAKEFIFLN